MADGWIKVWRKLADSQIWLEKPFSKGQAWIDLLMLATSSDHVSKYKGKDKSYKAGTVHFSLCFLTDRWGWSRNKVYRFINKLQNDGMLEYQGRTPNGTIVCNKNGTINDTTDGTNNDTVLIVVNWALYQGRQTKNGTIDETTDGTANGTAKRTSNGTHPKNDIHKNDYSKEGKKRKRTSPIEGVGDVAKAEQLKPIDQGTIDDIPIEYRDFCQTYADYWRYRNR